MSATDARPLVLEAGLPAELCEHRAGRFIASECVSVGIPPPNPGTLPGAAQCACLGGQRGGDRLVSMLRAWCPFPVSCWEENAGLRWRGW